MSAPAGEGTPADRSGLPFDTIGDFRLISRIAAGAMGTVYRARQISMGREVALKVLHEHLSDDTAFVQRFQREALAFGSLHHPNIVEGITAGEADGRYFLAMEFVDGEPLDERIRRDGPLSIDDAVRVATTLARALDHAHTRGTLHRDVKPSNVIVTPDGGIKLTDLGLARLVHGSGKATDAGDIIGTLPYMSPEQIHDPRAVDSRTDIYSLGVTLYELLTGGPPFEGSPYDVLQAKRAGDYRPVAQRNPAVPESLSRIVDRMMAVAPQDRFASAAEIVHALENYADYVAPPAAPRASNPRRGRLRTALAAFLLVATIAAATVFVLDRPDSEPPKSPLTVAERAGLAEYASRLVSAGPQSAQAFLEQNGGRNGDGAYARAWRELTEGTVVLFQSEDGTHGRANPMQPLEAVGEAILSSADNYRLAVRPSRACWIYVFQIDERPSVARLFPNPKFSARDNPIKKDELFWWPDDGPEGWAHLDDFTGDESLVVVAVTHPLRDENAFTAALIDNPEESAVEDHLPREGKSCFAGGGLRQLRIRHVAPPR